MTMGDGERGVRALLVLGGERCAVATDTSWVLWERVNGGREMVGRTEDGFPERVREWEILARQALE